MTREEWINSKAQKLISTENYKPDRAFAVASILAKKGFKAQQGAWYQNNPSPLNNYEDMSPNKPSEADYNIYNQQQNSTQDDGQLIDPNDTSYEGNKPNYWMKQRMAYNKEQNSTERWNSETGQYEDNYDAEGNAISPEQNQMNSQRIQIANPYTGVSLENSLFTLGQGIGQNDPWKTGLGAGLSALKIGRTGLSGYASGKETRRVYDENYKNLYADNRRPEMLQQGGSIKNSEVMTGKFLVDNPNEGNVEIENNEHVKDNQTGEVRKAVGETHENGGISVQLDDAKILSDYTKIGAKNAKELRDKYKISVTAKDTFAKAMDKVNKKIGVDKSIDEQATFIEKLGKNEDVKDEKTRILNETVLSKKVEEQEEKLEALKPQQNEAFENIFARQEMIPKKGDGTQLLDKGGKVIEEEEVYQQGGIYNTPMTDEEEWLSKAPQLPVDRILYNVGTTEQKQGLNPGNYTRVDYKNGRQDYLDAQGLEDFRRTTNYRIYMDSQKPLKTNLIASMQQGGEYLELAKKYNISSERAEQLMMQQGGELQPQEQAPQDPMEQVVQMIAQSLQQGVPPEQIAEQLTQMGVPPEQIEQLIQSVMQEMGAGQEQAPVEEGQQTMQQGGKVYAQEGKGFSFSTRYKPNLKGYETDGTSILDQDTLTGVEEFQSFTGKGYGAKMADVEKTLNAHPWYFNTEEKKKTFRQAVVKKGAQPEVKAFQEAYNREIEKRANAVGVPKEEVENIKKQVGFTTTGVQKVDGLYGAFTSTRPLYTFSKKDGKVEIKETDVQNTTPQPNRAQQQALRTMMPNLPVDFNLPPSALQPIAKPYVPLGRINPIKQTVEPYLAEQARQQLTSREQLAESGFAPQIQEALMAQNTAAGQLAANDAIGKVEQYNADNQFKTDQINMSQGDKERILNEEFNMGYQDKMMTATANQERDLNRYYAQLNLQNRRNFKDVSNINLTNAMFENFQSDGSNIYVNSPQKQDIGVKANLPANWDKMTGAEQDAWKREDTARRNAFMANKAYQSTQIS